MEAHQSQASTPSELEPIHPGSGRDQGLLKRFGGAAAAIGLVLVKFGAKLKVLLFALPKLKLFTTSASMLVSIVAYQLIFGWPFAVGFVLLLLLHEMGHVIQLRREGVEASAPMFIPFLGRRDLGQVAGQGRRGRGARRAGRADPGHDRDADPAGALARDGRRLLARARLHRLLPQPLQPAAGRAAGRRPRDGRALAVGLVRRLRRD